MHYRVILVCSIALSGCTRVNPAFDDDGLGDELGSESVGEGESGSGGSTSADASTGSEDPSTSADTGSTSVDTGTSADTDTSADTGTSDADTSSEGGSETGNACMLPFFDCDGECVDPKTDVLHCGSCDNSCGENEACVLGGCVVNKIIFVSSVPHNGAYANGINGVDDFCQGLADQAGYTGEFLAWNSTAQSTPNLDFDESGRYVRPDGAVVADSYAALVSGSLQHPINITEWGNAPLVVQQNTCLAVDDPVWSGTTPGGDFAGEPNCANWTTAGQLAMGKIGRMNATDGAWSQVDCVVACNNALPVYCVQQQP